MQLEYFSYLVVVMWLAWRDLNGGADIPVYSFLVGPDVMDATYISSVVWHSPLEWTRWLVSAVAGLFRFFRLRAEDRFVVAFDACSHIWHATVAYLDGVFCEYFSELRLRGEVLLNEREESSTDVCFHITAVGRVVPNHLPLPFLLFACFLFEL